MNNTAQSKMGYYFIVTASIIIVMYGVNEAAHLIVPFLFSLFLSVILLPFYSFFNDRGIPNTVSLFLIMGFFLLIIFFIGKLLSINIQQFNLNLPEYTRILSIKYQNFYQYALSYDIEIPVSKLDNIINTKNSLSFATQMIENLSAIFTNSFVILFTVIFMLLESKFFSYKIRLISKHNQNNTAVHIKSIINHIKEYMVLKTIVSLMTGAVIWIGLTIIGTDYAFLWAVIAFLFNYIPNIGSIIAAIPAVLLTLIQFDLESVGQVALLYIVVNVIMGSVVEPKLMGKGLGLSALVVFLSLLFWGGLLGIVGMLLAIPLTIIIKIVLDSNENTKWIAILLGNSEIKYDQIKIV